MQLSRFLKQTTTSILLSAAMVPAAHADQFSDSGLYIGGGYGWSKIDGSDFNDDVDFPHLFAGLQILPFLGIEASYYDFGEYGTSLINAETEAYSLALTGRIPLTSTVAIFAKAGPMWSDSDVSVGAFEANFDNEELLAGAGISFEVTENLDLKLAYDWVDLDLDTDDLDGFGSNDFNADINLLSLGLQLEF